MQNVFALSEFGIECYGRVIAMVSLHKNDLCASGCRDWFQGANQFCRDSSASIFFEHSEILNVKLTALLLKLHEFISSQRTNYLALLNRYEANKAIGF